MAEVLGLLAAQGTYITEIVRDFAASKERGESTDDFAWLLVAGSPDLVAAAIALSADEPDQSNLVSTLPLGMQVSMFVQVLVLTFMSARPEHMCATLQESIAPFATHLHGTIQ